MNIKMEAPWTIVHNPNMDYLHTDVISIKEICVMEHTYNIDVL